MVGPRYTFFSVWECCAIRENPKKSWTNLCTNSSKASREPLQSKRLDAEEGRNAVMNSGRYLEREYWEGDFRRNDEMDLWRNFLEKARNGNEINL